jgi:hypothetical protein
MLLRRRIARAALAARHEQEILRDEARSTSAYSPGCAMFASIAPAPVSR